MSLAEEEADETEYWLELLDELQQIPEEPLSKLRDEAHQITSMIVVSIKTARTKE
jgi:four helix bundle protein